MIFFITLIRPLYIAAKLLLLSLFIVLPTAANAQPSESPFADVFAEKSGLDATLSKRVAALDAGSVAVTILGSHGRTHSAYVGDNVSEMSLFQGASMSKSVTAVGVLILAHRHDIDLDEDVRPHISSLNWQEIMGGDAPVTLRQLLSHTGGATVSGFPGYRRTKTLPTSVEIVQGRGAANTSAVKLKREKGTFAYSGGGYQILQVFVEDITGQSFEQAMRDHLLGPLEMDASGFTQPIDPETIAPFNIVPAHAPFNPMLGVLRSTKGTWHNYPELAAAGLWTTPEDFAKFVLMLAHAEQGVPVLGLSGDVLSPMFEGGGRNYGLGLMLAIDDTGNLSYFGHTGGNRGYRCIFRFAPDKGVGVIGMANSHKGIRVMKEVIAGLSEFEP